MKQPKQIALELIAPYYIDPTICGIEDGECRYTTSTGKHCVIYGCMQDPDKWGNQSIDDILFDNLQINVFKSEWLNIFTDRQWINIQAIHDNLAGEHPQEFSLCIEALNLFTLAELEEYCTTLKTK